MKALYEDIILLSIGIAVIAVSLLSIYGAVDAFTQGNTQEIAEENGKVVVIITAAIVGAIAGLGASLLGAIGLALDLPTIHRNKVNV